MSRPQRGFTLIELMVVLGITAVILGVALPVGARMYDTMQYRDTVRQMTAAATAARFQAITGGRSLDLLLRPDARQYAISPVGQSLDAIEFSPLADELAMDVISAREVSPGPGVAAIRFFPEGGSSGGSISLIRDNGDGVRLRVDWLLGRITQEPLELP